MLRFIGWITRGQISLAWMVFLWQMNGMRRWYPFLALLLLLIAFRLVGAWQGWMNVSPLPAFFLMSMACFAGRERWILPMAVWVISDPLVNVVHGESLWSWHQSGLLFGIAATMAIAPWVKTLFSWHRALLGTVAVAVLFYFVTNIVSFIGLAELYERSWQGFVQAQWTGPVGYGPTWVFLRNAVASNLLFTTFFLLALRPLSAYLPAPLAGSSAN